MFCVQVDSGYNTHSVCTNSLMDALSSDSQSKEMLETHTAEEGVPFTRHTKPKVMSHTHYTANISHSVTNYITFEYFIQLFWAIYLVLFMCTLKIHCIQLISLYK